MDEFLIGLIQSEMFWVILALGFAPLAEKLPEPWGGVAKGVFDLFRQATTAKQIRADRQVAEDASVSVEAVEQIAKTAQAMNRNDKYKLASQRLRKLYPDMPEDEIRARIEASVKRMNERNEKLDQLELVLENIGT